LRVHPLPKLAFDYRIEDFQRFEGEEVEFGAVPEAVKVRLDSVTQLRSPSFLTRPGFSLNFSTDYSVQLLGGIYEMRVSSSEVYSIYVEPVLFVGNRRKYQSVFF
jgi:hypothetical protein